VLLEGRVRLTTLALAPKHQPDELEFLDILDERFPSLFATASTGISAHWRTLGSVALLEADGCDDRRGSVLDLFHQCRLSEFVIPVTVAWL
jgi:hypothetical protein